MDFATVPDAGTRLPRPAQPRRNLRAGTPCRRHLLGVDDLSDAELLALTHPAGLAPMLSRGPWGTLGMLFEQPSLRTASGFAASGLRVGLVPVQVNARGHEVRAQLNLADELHQLSVNTDCVVVRASEPLDPEALRTCPAPVINAGDGCREHPTQALIDLAALRALGLDGQRVTLMGNLRDHRTQHSLARVLMRLGVQVTLLAPPGMAMPAAFAGGVVTVESEDDEVVDEILSGSDFVYLTPTRYWNTLQPHGGSAFRLDLARAQRVLREGAVVLHPFPRLDELDVSLDASSFNGYHRQLAGANAVRARALRLLLEA